MMKQVQWKLSSAFSLEFSLSTTLKRPSPRCCSSTRRSGAHVMARWPFSEGGGFDRLTPRNTYRHRPVPELVEGTANYADCAKRVPHSVASAAQQRNGGRKSFRAAFQRYRYYPPAFCKFQLFITILRKPLLPHETAVSLHTF